MSNSISSLMSKYSIKATYGNLNREISFEDYLALVRVNPALLRNAYQRLFDMVIRDGYKDYKKLRTTYRRWLFFDDATGSGKDAIFGIDNELNRLVEILGAGAKGYGVDKRLLLLHGPVGSAKSTIARLLKRGLERYSKSAEGEMYTFQIFDTELEEWVLSPMHEEPIKLIPAEIRNDFVEDLLDGQPYKYPLTSYKGNLDPASQKYFDSVMKLCKGDWDKATREYVKVVRLVVSEKNRMCIGTYQPKDEKSQDATELTGDINYRKIAIYGSDSDPRAFNFDGEFNVANRGLIEFVEVLKLETAFLYDLLTASQEKQIKPRKFAQTDIDEVILGHTNNPEYRKLQNDDLMEAFRDRTIKIDIGYNLEVTEELRIYERDFNASNVEKHIAPHTLRVAAMWVVLTRLKDPRDSNITLMQKLKLYDGKTLPGYTVDNVQETKGRGPGFQRRDGWS